MTDNRTTERVDHPPRVREAIDELMREKDANDNRTTELLQGAEGGGRMSEITVDMVRDLIEQHSDHISGNTREFYNGAYAEIADELNSRAERTCKPLGTIRYDYEGGYAGFEYETELSCGHKWRDAYGDYPDYCPSCGCKVVGE